MGMVEMKLTIIRSWENVQRPALLSTEQIIGASYRITKQAGIYFLIKDDAVVYVGATTNYHERLGRHLAKRKVVFDSITFLPVDDQEKMWRLETYYIEQFNCEANKVKHA